MCEIAFFTQRVISSIMRPSLFGYSNFLILLGKHILLGHTLQSLSCSLDISTAVISVSSLFLISYEDFYNDHNCERTQIS